jgi:hypothetical protein
MLGHSDSSGMMQRAHLVDFSQARHEAAGADGEGVDAAAAMPKLMTGAAAMRGEFYNDAALAVQRS